MPETLRPALLLACAVWASASAAYAAEDATQAITLPLTHVEARDAVVIIRTIADTTGVRVVDDHTISLRDTSDHLALAEGVVKMVDIPSGAANESSLAVSDGSKIVGVLLKHALAIDVLKALRKDLHIARVATLGEGRIFLRDTEAQIQLALDLIRKMDDTNG